MCFSDHLLKAATQELDSPLRWTSTISVTHIQRSFINTVVWASWKTVNSVCEVPLPRSPCNAFCDGHKYREKHKGHAHTNTDTATRTVTRLPTGQAQIQTHVTGRTEDTVTQRMQTWTCCWLNDIKKFLDCLPP